MDLGWLFANAGVFWDDGYFIYVRKKLICFKGWFLAFCVNDVFFGWKILSFHVFCVGINWQTNSQNWGSLKQSKTSYDIANFNQKNKTFIL